MGVAMLTNLYFNKDHFNKEIISENTSLIEKLSSLGCEFDIQTRPCCQDDVQEVTFAFTSDPPKYYFWGIKLPSWLVKTIGKDKVVVKLENCKITEVK
jgi:hypothetical protein